MGQKDWLIQIFSDVSVMNCNYVILGRNAIHTSNAISEALEYWRKEKVARWNNIENPQKNQDLINSIKFASVKSINVIEITPV